MSNNQPIELASIRHKLTSLASVIKSQQPQTLFENAERHSQCVLELEGLYFDWSLQRIDIPAFESLLEYAQASRLLEQLQDQLTGKPVNQSENRAALHATFRGAPSLGDYQGSAYQDELNRCKAFAQAVLDGEIRSHSDQPFTDVVHVGIGGSYLGQKLLCEALKPSRLKMHFLANVSSKQWNSTINELHPNTTLFIIASKSFSTPETLKNYQKVKAWLSSTTATKSSLSKNIVLVTANDENLSQADCYAFSMPNTTGGRFSLWSTMGLPIMLGVGVDQFDSLLAGARAVDEHVCTSVPTRNIPLVLALLEHWNINYLGTRSHVILSYIEELRLMTAHLQQLEMESLGKSVQHGGDQVKNHTNTVIWGGEETEGQHAWHQWLHQGTHEYSADVICTSQFDSGHDQWVFANALAQQEMMFFGHANPDQTHKNVKGGHGSNLLLLKDKSAHTLGLLIALYEHKVALLGLIWGVNAFDQWGVEQGKVLADKIDNLLSDPSNQDLSTQRAQRLHKIASRFAGLKPTPHV